MTHRVMGHRKCRGAVSSSSHSGNATGPGQCDREDEAPAEDESSRRREPEDEPSPARIDPRIPTASSAAAISSVASAAASLAPSRSPAAARAVARSNAFKPRSSDARSPTRPTPTPTVRPTGVRLPRNPRPIRTRERCRRRVRPPRRRRRRRRRRRPSRSAPLPRRARRRLARLLFDGAFEVRPELRPASSRRDVPTPVRDARTGSPTPPTTTSAVVTHAGATRNATPTNSKTNARATPGYAHLCAARYAADRGSRASPTPPPSRQRRASSIAPWHHIATSAKPIATPHAPAGASSPHSSCARSAAHAPGQTIHSANARGFTRGRVWFERVGGWVSPARSRSAPSPRRASRSTRRRGQLVTPSISAERDAGDDARHADKETTGRTGRRADSEEGREEGSAWAEREGSLGGEGGLRGGEGGLPGGEGGLRGGEEGSRAVRKGSRAVRKGSEPSEPSEPLRTRASEPSFEPSFEPSSFSFPRSSLPRVAIHTLARSSPCSSRCRLSFSAATETARRLDRDATPSSTLNIASSASISSAANTPRSQNVSTARSAAHAPTSASSHAAVSSHPQVLTRRESARISGASPGMHA